MMNISEITDKKKSVMLARLNPAWRVVDLGYHGQHEVFCSKTNEPLFVISKRENFFTNDKHGNPHFFGWAWRVLNWAVSVQDVGFVNYGNGFVHKPLEAVSHLFSELVEYEVYFDLPPADAQRAWLDKILQLAIEAGMVTK